MGIGMHGQYGICVQDSFFEEMFCGRMLFLVSYTGLIQIILCSFPGLLLDVGDISAMKQQLFRY